jgi:hypothetical protein
VKQLLEIDKLLKQKLLEAENESQKLFVRMPPQEGEENYKFESSGNELNSKRQGKDLPYYNVQNINYSESD